MNKRKWIKENEKKSVTKRIKKSKNGKYNKKTLMTKITGKQKEQNVLEIPLKKSRGQIKKRQEKYPQKEQKHL